LRVRTTLDELRETRFALRYPGFLGTLAQSLAAAGQAADARTTIDDALERSERTEERWCVAELLRIKGDLARVEEAAEAIRIAEDHYLQALEWARRQEALSSELRAATSLADLWHQNGRTAAAAVLLSSVYDRFDEGFETIDFQDGTDDDRQFSHDTGLYKKSHD